MVQKIKKYGLYCLMFTLLWLSVVTNVSAASLAEIKYKDVSEDEWYYEVISLAGSYGLMSGVGKDLFHPNMPTTRAQVAQTIYNMEGRPEVSYEMVFSDVLEDEWFAPAITWASQNGVVKGYTDGTFQPNANITREDIILLLHRYIGTPKPINKNLKFYLDYKNVSDYAKTAMEWAIEESILQGDPTGTIRPKDTATRAELAAILVRFHEKIANEEFIPTAVVPILMYHHLDTESTSKTTVISPEKFRHQMQLLQDYGYQVITIEDMIGFVENGDSLPDKAVVITFDDGYLSNYEYGYPILKEYNYEATIFVIGSSVGHYEYYKDTQFKLTPHFGEKEIAEMTASGLISIQTHTYDMHQWPAYESSGKVRENLLPLANESIDAYRRALLKDMEKQNELFDQLGLRHSNAMAYPLGKHNALVDSIVQSNGIKVTLTIDDSRVNMIRYQDPKSLMNLGRLNVCEETTDEEFLAYCSMTF